MRIHSQLLIKNAFRVNKDAIRQYLSVSIKQITKEIIDLHIGFPDLSEYHGRLVSDDGFNYRSIEHSSCTQYIIVCKCFMHSQKVLLFGNWMSEHSKGEICIHAELQDSLIETEKTSNWKELPPAA